tara:strand:- start:179 stop:796 length:618 start_codon:yes stop_codon:yes gene_type:complete
VQNKKRIIIKDILKLKKFLMKKLHYTLWMLLILSSNLLGQDFQYHIHERYYNHHDTLRQFPYGSLHVYLQGPMIEKAIKRNLKLNAIKCDANINSNYIFSIEPQVFYNPSMTTLHGEFKVKIFTSQNMNQATQLIKVQHQARINQKANFYINKIYDELIIKLSKKILDNLPKNNQNINGDFCTMIETSKSKENKKKKDYKRPIQA